MFVDTMKTLLLAEPFEPFEIRLANGDIHQVDDPWDVAIGKNAVTILFSNSKGTAWCAPNQIVSIEKVAGAEPRPNGRAPRRR